MSTGLPLANCNPCLNCPPAPGVLTPCVDSEPCEELSLLGCIKYNGDPIVEANIANGERLDSIIQKLIIGQVSGLACISPTLKCVTALRSTVVKANSITVAWNVPTDNTTLTLMYKTEAAGTFTSVPVNAQTSKEILSLSANTKYLFKVASTASGNTNCTSVTIAVTTKAS